MFEELSRNFILSSILDENERKFYSELEDSNSEKDDRWNITYDNQDLMLVDMEYLNGYADPNNNSLVSVNQMAKIIFHQEILKTQKIKPITNKEIDQIVKKLVNHQIHEYKGLKKEEYVFFHNHIKTEILDIVNAEPEESLEIIKNSIFFNESEKKAATLVFEKKNEYFCSFLNIPIAEKAIEENKKINETVSFRMSIFEKRYIFSPSIVLSYINFLIEQASQLEFKEISDPENSPGSVTDQLEKIRNTLVKIAELDPCKLIYKGKDTIKYIKFLYAKKVLETIFNKNSIKLQDIQLSQIPKHYDMYLLKGIIKMFIDNIDINIITFTLSRQEKLIDPVVQKLAKKRIKRIQYFINKNKSYYIPLLKEKYGYNKYNINFILKYKD